MAIYDLTQNIPTDITAGDILNCPYSGTYKTLTLPKGTYKLECWGAQGGSYNTTYYGGKGGYSVGTISLESDLTIYCFVGGQGTNNITSYSTVNNGGFNGGGSSSYKAGSGGGASDVRIGSDSLYSRVLVAGGGGGGAYYSSSVNGIGGYGGGTSAGNGTTASGSYDATQCGAGGSATAGGAAGSDSTRKGNAGTFGQGGANTNNASGYNGMGAGGGGWYGGGAASKQEFPGGGGSGYVYTSSTASNYPSGCLLDSSMYLTDAQTIAGNASMPSTSGSTETGHSGNGYVRITVISIDSGLPIKMKVNGEIVKASAGYVKIDGNWKEINSIYTKKNGEWIN